MLKNLMLVFEWAGKVRATSVANEDGCLPVVPRLVTSVQLHAAVASSTWWCRLSLLPLVRVLPDELDQCPS